MELATAVTVTIEFMCSIFLVNLIVVVTQAINVDIFMAKKNDLSHWISHNLFKKENANKPTGASFSLFKNEHNFIHLRIVRFSKR